MSVFNTEILVLLIDFSILQRFNCDRKSAFYSLLRNLVLTSCAVRISRMAELPGWILSHFRCGLSCDIHYLISVFYHLEWSFLYLSSDFLNLFKTESPIATHICLRHLKSICQSIKISLGVLRAPLRGVQLIQNSTICRIRTNRGNSQRNIN